MLTSMRKFFTEKGQGLTEYVLILAFVAGLAYLMFFNDNGLRGTVSSSFSQSASAITSTSDKALGNN